MATLTQLRNGTWLYHDVDTNRQALHDRYAAWNETGMKGPTEADTIMNVDTFTFQNEGQAPIYTIVVTFVLKADVRAAERRYNDLLRQFQDMQRRLREIERAADAALAIAQKEG